jgi:GT2 family glycosyltransferase
VTAPIAAGVVTYNSRDHIERCLDALRAQSVPLAEILVWDNASADDSAALARSRGARVQPSARNLGFAAGANELIRRATAPYFLLVNPDAYLAPDYGERLLAVAESDPGVGSLTGKLVRPNATGGPVVLDSTGHVLYRNRYPLNRGSDEVDRGQYEATEEVFGVCAAAALYRRAMLEDVRIGDAYFDPAFFMYLEDVDLDWRARLRGWRAMYVPAAVAVHHRGHQGKRRTRNPAVLRHSLKNRYLMMARNDRFRDVIRDLPAILVMDLLRVTDYALTHPTALRGFLDLPPLLPQALADRRAIQGRRRLGSAGLRPWLRPYPFRARLRGILRDLASR